jgi:hypothetical protein
MSHRVSEGDLKKENTINKPERENIAINMTDDYGREIRILSARILECSSLIQCHLRLVHRFAGSRNKMKSENLKQFNQNIRIPRSLLLNEQDLVLDEYPELGDNLVSRSRNNLMVLFFYCKLQLIQST